MIKKVTQKFAYLIKNAYLCNVSNKYSIHFKFIKIMATNNTNSVRVNKSNVMKSAWAMLKAKSAKTLSEALHKAWVAMKAKAIMYSHKVKIHYIKADGSVREALATLKLNFDYTKKGNRKPCYSTVCYFDLEKKAFRSFSIATFLGVEEVID